MYSLWGSSLLGLFALGLYFGGSASPLTYLLTVFQSCPVRLALSEMLIPFLFMDFMSSHSSLSIMAHCHLRGGGERARRVVEFSAAIFKEN